VIYNNPKNAYRVHHHEGDIMKTIKKVEQFKEFAKEKIVGKWVRTIALGVALCVATPLVGQAQTADAWVPNKPIRMIVPYPPGGGSDTIARIVVQALGNRLGQPIVVENRAGANGAIGTEAVFNAAPDGYTLLMSSGDTYSMYPALYPNARFVASEFVPVAPSAVVNFVIMGREGLPAKTLPELITLAKKDKLTYSTWGNGSGAHIAMSLFNSVTKTDMMHVPYQGAAPAAQAVVAGQVDLAMMPVPLAASFRTKLIPFGVASEGRIELIKDIPTLTENGSPVQASVWVGVLAPPKTPANIVATLSKALMETMEDPEVGKRLNAAGLVPLNSNSKDFSAYLAKDYAFWGKIIKDSGIKVAN
jgi:tripartite-type tricarboxylate transporter receptor subunit TctC